MNDPTRLWQNGERPHTWRLSNHTVGSLDSFIWDHRGTYQNFGLPPGVRAASRSVGEKVCIAMRFPMAISLHPYLPGSLCQLAFLHGYMGTPCLDLC